MKRQSEVLAEEMQVLRTEVQVILDKGEDATEEELSRSEALLEEWDQKKEVYDKAVARETKVDEVMRTHLNPGNRESSNERRGPEIMRKVDPYDEGTYNELKRSVLQGPERINFNTEPVISRALAAIEQAPKAAFTSTRQHDLARERMTELVEMDNVHSPLIARHMLLTGSDEYRRAFKEYVQSAGLSTGEVVRTAMSLTAANGGVLVGLAT